MNIVIVGDGKVGFALSEQLNLEGHDITIIDNNLAALNDTMETLDVMGVHGNGAVRGVQLEAGVQDADLLIAATSTDELNMLCCLLGKTLGAQNTIARIRNPEYMAQLHLLQKQLGLSMAINPELAAARAISRVIKFPPAIKVDTFAKGRVYLVEFRLPAGSPMVGHRLMDMPRKPDAKVLVCAVDRDGEVTIPSGPFVLEAGDRLHITGESHAITTFLGSIGGMNFKIRSMIVVGGGRRGYYLGKKLDDRPFQLKIIEKNLDRCNELCELLPRAAIIHGDGSDVELLESEGLDDVDAFVALTGIDEENLIMSMVASHKKVPKVVTKVNRLSYLAMVEKMGIDTVISPKVTTADEITQYVRAMQNTVDSGGVDTLYKLVGGKAEALEFTARDTTHHLGETLQEVRLKPGLLVAVIVRQGKVIIPDGKTFIQSGDSVVVIANQYQLGCLNDIFEE